MPDSVEAQVASLQFPGVGCLRLFCSEVSITSLAKEDKRTERQESVLIDHDRGSKFVKNIRGERTMKTQWCVRFRHIALAGVLLLGMTASAVYAQGVRSTCEGSSDPSCVIDTMQMISPNLLVIPTPCTEVSVPDCVPQLKIVDLSPSHQAQQATSVRSAQANTSELPLRVRITRINDELAIFLNGFQIYHRYFQQNVLDFDDVVDLTGLLLSGRNSLIFVGVNIVGAWEFFVDVLLGDAVVARYHINTGSFAEATSEGIVWNASLLIER